MMKNKEDQYYEDELALYRIEPIDAFSLMLFMITYQLKLKELK